MVRLAQQHVLNNFKKPKIFAFIGTHQFVPRMSEIINRPLKGAYYRVNFPNFHIQPLVKCSLVGILSIRFDGVNG